MSEESPANKRRRTHTCTAAAALDITSLPDAVLRHCFSFIGKGRFRFVAGVNHQFWEAYSITRNGEGEETATGFDSKTTWKAAASSVARAQLCLEDWKEKTEREKGYVLVKLSFGASKLGRIEVLEWARNMGFEFMPLSTGKPDEQVFEVAAKNGQQRVLEWAKELNLDWYSDVEIQFAAGTGDISVFERAYSTGRDLATSDCLQSCVQRIAIHNEQFGVLKWLKDHHLLGPRGLYIWQYATIYESMKTLDWAHQNGYPLDFDYVVTKAIEYGSQNTVVWALKQGAEWNTEYCKVAAQRGKLGMLQWFRENDCPWDSDVIQESARRGHEHVVTWARENGCPEP